MKIEDLAYRIAGETMALLQKKHHYHISPEHKKEVQAEIRDSVGKFIGTPEKP